MTSIRRIRPSADLLALLNEAAANAGGLVRAVTTRQRTPDPSGVRRAEQLAELADRDLVKLHAITGDKNSPIGEHVIVYAITPKGREAQARRKDADHRNAADPRS